MLFLLALSSAVAGFVVIRSSPTSSGPSFEIGKWLLQLATVFTGGGFITAVFRQVEVTRTKREAWTTMLQDVVVAQDALEGAFMRLISNTNAETYTDMIEKCREMRAMLRRIIALPEAYDRPGDLRRHVQGMRNYLKPLIQEYESHYLRVMMQGKLDEKVLEARLEELAKDARPLLPTDLLQPMCVGNLLRDAQEFPALAACLNDFNDSEIQFKEDSDLDSAYESLKLHLQRVAGVDRRR
ncbi:hypothetical protein NLX85_18000 [Micromonospora sp. A3M-1-15]|uniref:hypothetical protein n=1 Tax=Micromonospora sp. A3M-1-15 TaxID=2962035 RepID=UPI0020B657D4|nr:hypothetical protein [Micromonospora sp. A3M-1-15]MCP3785261.1 hypothetical protein [Micromonospora sp. A3M-1-15]